MNSGASASSWHRCTLPCRLCSSCSRASVRYVRCSGWGCGREGYSYSRSALASRSTSARSALVMGTRLQWPSVPSWASSCGSQWNPLTLARSRSKSSRRRSRMRVSTCSMAPRTLASVMVHAKPTMLDMSRPHLIAVPLHGEGACRPSRIPSADWRVLLSPPARLARWSGLRD